MKEIYKVLLLGSGALKIGEAGEFDYSGTQAIKALKENGKKVILVNPNIATIQTSDDLADKVYLLPVNADFVTKVIEKEKPDGILLSFGGQTALNCGLELYKRGVLAKHAVSVLGTPIAAILATEDRKEFREKLNKLGLKAANGLTVSTVKEAQKFAEIIGFPIMLRTGFALGGAGSGVIKNSTELNERVEKALSVYPQIILEECLWGWKEIEYEVIRDCDDNCITVCNMENFDPTGIHTGESIVVAPSQTLTNDEYFKLREYSLKTIKCLKIVGECNIQFALHSKTGDYRIIEVNARLSRSSALASKATGYPLAYVAAQLALGKRLWELPNKVTGKTTAFFEPALDYIVIKVPRWDIDKFTNADRSIGSEMKSVGEVMSIGRSFEESVQKAIRMLAIGSEGVMDMTPFPITKKEVINNLRQPSTIRIFAICQALFLGMTVKKIQKLTQIDPWFLGKLKNISDTYKNMKSKKLTRNLIQNAKENGFSDIEIAKTFHTSPQKIRMKRKQANIIPKIKQIDTTAGEFPAQTNYLYMTYLGIENDHNPTKTEKKIIVLGCGPYAIGTSVEFDWCAVNTVKQIRKYAIYGIMINCNPETVSTDFDHSDYLYFEELTLERVLDIYDAEKADMIVSVGGQIPNNLALGLTKYGVKILGTSPKYINKAENRESFSKLLDSLFIPQPKWGRAYSIKESKLIAKRITYPVLLRPSFVLSGKSMRVVTTDSELESYLNSLTFSLKDHPLLMSYYLDNARECDFDGVAKDGKLLAWAISEHVEKAGVHSGDSTMIHPAIGLSIILQDQIHKLADKIIKSLKVSGPFNIQFLIDDENIFVIECNLRASRSLPYISKIQKTNYIALATDVLLNKKTTQVRQKLLNYVGVKVPQFSFQKLKGADPVLKVEMNSTGEVAAFGKDAYEAYLKAVISTGFVYPQKKSAFISLGGMKSKLQFISSAKLLSSLSYKLYATSATHLFLKDNGVESIHINKTLEGGVFTARDLIIKKMIDFAVVIPETVINSPQINQKAITDGYQIRRTAIDYGLPIMTNVQSAAFFIQAISRYTLSKLEIKDMSSYV